MCWKLILILTGQDLLLIESLPQDTVLLCGEILLLGEVRSKEQGFTGRALEPNTGLWVWGSVRSSGSRRCCLIFFKTIRCLWSYFAITRQPLSLPITRSNITGLNMWRLTDTSTKEKLDNGCIRIPCIPSSQQIADILIKGLLRQSFN